MKKLILILALLITMASCSKEYGCGVVAGGNYEYSYYSGYTGYYLYVRFSSNKTTKVYVDYITFISYRVGDQICF
jgi:hypothetical protein